MVPAKCHPERPHNAHGLCSPCYARKRYRDPKIAEPKKAKQRAAYAADPETFRAYHRAWKARVA